MGIVGTWDTLTDSPLRRVRALSGLFCPHASRELTLTCGLLFLCAAVASPGGGHAFIGPNTAARDATAHKGTVVYSGFWWFLH